MTKEWKVIGQDDNYIQIARHGILVAHVLTESGAEEGGRKTAADIVSMCNAYAALKRWRSKTLYILAALIVFVVSVLLQMLVGG